jgi:phage shock protein E
MGSGLIVLALMAATLATACAPSDDQQAGAPGAPAQAAQPADATPPPAPAAANPPAEPASPTDAPAKTGGPAASPVPPPAPAPAPPVIVDVRTQQEYAAGHVQGAILIPHDQMEQRWQELEAFRDQPVVLYCRSGRRSGIALEVLRTKGFTQLENGGGIDAMAARGFTVTKD